MNITYDKEKLKKTLIDVYALLQTPISIFDRDFNYIVSNDKMTDYCTLLRCDESRVACCRKSDSEACAKCKQSGETFSYRCHGNVFETITPITYEKHLLGYIIFGQYRMDSEEKAVIEYAQKHGIDEQLFLSHYRRVPMLTQAQVDAVCNILKSCILCFTLSDAITLRKSDVAEKIRSFIENNPQEKITAEFLCRKFFINRGRLYSVFRQNFNATVKEFVLAKKIEYTKHLLKTTSLSVTEISEKAGFPDYSYFIQRFKKCVGATPLRYRKG